MFLNMQKLLTTELCGAVVCGLVWAITAKAPPAALCSSCVHPWSSGLLCREIELFRAHIVVHNEMVGGLEAPSLPEDVCRMGPGQSACACMCMQVGAPKPALLGRDLTSCIMAQKQPS